MDNTDIQPPTGLSQKEADERLRRDGFNEIPSEQKPGILRLLKEVIKEPMILLLIASATVYLVVGEPTDALMLVISIMLIIGITIYQQGKTERALEALKNLSSPRALVIRDGERKRIAGREVVKDDIIILSEGDRVPADATVIEGVNLSVDESILTGESLAVKKTGWDGKMSLTRPGGENLPFVYSGTLVISGRGAAKVHAAGIYTEFGKIGKALENLGDEQTFLQKQIKKLVRNFALWGLFLCLMVTALYGMYQGYTQGFLAGVTLAISVLPEEFPVVLTVFMALGAWRMSKDNVLARRTQAIEALGSATVLCVDKTGTITMNKMKMAANRPSTRATEYELISYSVYASAKEPFDPLEKACIEAKKNSVGSDDNNMKQIKEYPFTSKLMAVTYVWESENVQNRIVSAKGAPEAVMSLCNLSQAERAEQEKTIHEMASLGLRILGVAKSEIAKEKSLPEDVRQFNWTYLGLIAFADPIRETVPEAVKICHEAGIKVIMITGDYPETARNIGRQIGLFSGGIITGVELEKLSDDELSERIGMVNIFARVVPEQKLRIVNALKKKGEVVAMTGDGVNDAPALKAAHIGVAMGERGTDVAREASDLVLVDDDFTSIVSAVSMGRRIFHNIKKALSYVFAVHVPVAGMALLPAVFKLPLVFLPLHIVFLELVIDPASSIVFEAIPADKDNMKKPPRPLNKSLISLKNFSLSVLQGFIVFLAVVLTYFTAKYFGRNQEEIRAMAFTTLVIANLGLILANISWKERATQVLRSHNKPLLILLVATVAMLLLVLYVPFLRNLFHFAPLNWVDLGMSVGFALLGFGGLELMKRR